MPNFIFTKHALARLEKRAISQAVAESVLAHPDRTIPGKKAGTVKFIRRVHDRNIQIIATYLADQKKWLVLSAWVRGEDDRAPLLWQVITAPFKLIAWLWKRQH